jgi:hypothetical protein
MRDDQSEQDERRPTAVVRAAATRMNAAVDELTLVANPASPMWRSCNVSHQKPIGVVALSR